MRFVLYPLICAAAAGIILVAARLLRLRYSLRSLAIFILLAGCCEALWLHWEPWYCSSMLAGEKGSFEAALCFSPDGSQVASTVEQFKYTRGVDGYERFKRTHVDAPCLVRNADTGARVLDVGIEESPYEIVSLAFNPGGEHIAAACDDYLARIWDAKTGARRLLLRGHSSSLATVSYSPAGDLVVTSSFDHTARIWDASTGDCICVLNAQDTWNPCVSFSLDGTRVVTSSKDNTARVWDARTGAEMTVLRGHSHGVRAAKFSPDGKLVATASVDMTARIWDARDGNCLRVLRDHRCPVTDIDWSPDGSTVVTTEAVARIWRTEDWTCIGTLQAREGTMLSGVFLSDGKRIMTTAGDAARVWSVSTGQCLEVLEVHGDGCVAAAASPDGRRIAVANAGCIRTWKRGRPEWWWGVFCMLEFWFSFVFAAALVWSLFADRRAFARMDAEAAREREGRR